MKGFGFTQKKFSSLSDRGQHTHVVAWLSAVYQRLGAGRTSENQLSDMAREYRRVCQWMDLPCPVPPVSGNTRAWLAYVSDAIHSHRTLSGKVVRDYDLLDKVVIGDRERPGPPRPRMEYQVALDGLRSLFNVGSIFRTCEAAGIGTLILGNCMGKQSPQVRKTAMGTQDAILEEPTQDLAQVLTDKKRQGYRIICLETLENAYPCHEYHWPEKAVIVVGNEEYGISAHVLRTMDDAVDIPMFGKKNSLNVANALSAVLYQAVFTRMTQS